MARLAVVVVTAAVLPSIFVGDVRLYWIAGRHLSLHHLPYRDFLWEFPPLTVPVLALARLASAAAGAGGYGLFFIAFVAVMAAAEYGSLVVLRRSRPAGEAASITAFWHVAGLPLATIALYRLDYLALLPATLALVALLGDNRRRRASGAIVAGFAAKLWPAVLLVGLVAQRRYRQAAVAVAGMLAVVAGWWAFSPSGFRHFLAFRRGDGLQVESLLGGVRLLTTDQRPVLVSGAWVIDRGRMGWVEPLLMLAVAVTAVALLAVSRWRDRPLDVACLTGGLVAALMLASRLLSPQYLVWLLPFVALAWARGRRRIGALFVAASALSVVIMARYHWVIHPTKLMAGLIVVRNGLLLGVAVGLLWASLPAKSMDAS